MENYETTADLMENFHKEFHYESFVYDYYNKPVDAATGWTQAECDYHENYPY